MPTQQTRKRSKGNSIVVEKYTRNILGVDTRLYIIKLNQGFRCLKKMTLKKSVNPVTKKIKNNPKTYDLLTHKKKINTKEIVKNQKLTEKLIKFIKPYEKYTYCLTNDTLVLAETKASTNKTKMAKIIKNYTSKHFVLCGEDACASGEVVIKNNTFIFDNSSGTFEPTYENIKSLKKAIPFLNMKLVMMDTPEHATYFS
jgi:hypothetical protein